MFSGTKNRLTLIALIVLGLGVAALAWFLGAKPQLDTLERTNKEIAQEKGLNDVEQIAVANLRAQNENIEEFQTELEGYRKAIPQTALQSQLLRQISAASDKSKVTLTAVTGGDILVYAAPSWQQPAPDTGSDRFVGLKIEIEAEGGIADLRSFVGEVQKLERYITVNSVSYLGGSEEGKVQISGTTWVLLSPEQAAANAALGGSSEAVDDGADADGNNGAEGADDIGNADGF